MTEIGRTGDDVMCAPYPPPGINLLLFPGISVTASALSVFALPLWIINASDDPSVGGMSEVLMTEDDEVVASPSWFIASPGRNTETPEMTISIWFSAGSETVLRRPHTTTGVWRSS